LLRPLFLPEFHCDGRNMEKGFGTPFTSPALSASTTKGFQYPLGTPTPSPYSPWLPSPRKQTLLILPGSHVRETNQDRLFANW
jgi:hypothetical protein